MKKTNKSIPIILFSIITGMYLLFQNKTAGWGDSLSFLLSSLQGFNWSVNATGHFLYVNFNSLLITLFPFIDPIQLLTLSSIIFSVLTLFRIYQVVNLLTKNNTAALFSVITMSFSFTFWRQTEIIEVYSLYNFIIANVIYYIVEDLVSNNFRNPYKVGFWVGLGVLTHIQMILLLPFYLIYLFQGKMGLIQKSIYSLLLFSAITFILFIPVLFLNKYPLSSLFFDFLFKSKVLNIAPLTMIKGFIKSIFYIVYNFHFFLFFICHGLILCYQDSPKFFLYSGIIIFPVWLFAFRYTISDNYIFFLTAYIILSIISGYAYMFWTDKIQNQKIIIIILFISIILSPVLYYSAMKISYFVPYLENLDNRSKYKGGLRYYLWPGMENAIDPLELAIKQYDTGIIPENIDTIEWGKNYPIAIEYLKIKGKIEKE